ncbi:hypothetical protein BST61_g803 [Cercospora zeina]
MLECHKTSPASLIRTTQPLPQKPTPPNSTIAYSPRVDLKRPLAQYEAELETRLHGAEVPLEDVLVDTMHEECRTQDSTRSGGGCHTEVSQDAAGMTAVAFNVAASSQLPFPALQPFVPSEQ